jgi:Zn-dependent peptidase ImmA (M78 family)
MILSQRQLEEIAASTTKDFNRFFFGDEADKPDRSALPTPIDQFAKNYLGLRVSFARLSPDGSICGVTAYADTEYKITELGITRTLALKRNQVILDESFILSGNVQRLCAKRRFTLAHECAHQILFQLESEEVKTSCEMKYSARTAYTPRELKTREDWNEWQANVLGAAILLPQKEVDLAMCQFAKTPLINYEGRYSYGDHLTLRLFCRLFGVSKTTASMTALPSMTPKHASASASTVITRTKRRRNRQQPLRWSMTPHSKIPQYCPPFWICISLKRICWMTAGANTSGRRSLNTFKRTRALRNARSS